MNLPCLIGVSACIMHADPKRRLYHGKPLQYAEPSVLHWVMGAGALAMVIPAPDESLHAARVGAADFAARADGLLLEGGADVWPGAYGQRPLRAEWQGDRQRDDYEFALLRAFMDAGKPVLGVCRGLQVINVALGGTLYQDLPTQRPGDTRHREVDLFEHNLHAVDLEPGSHFEKLHAASPGRLVSSIHHQGVERLGDGLTVQARSRDDGLIEALRWNGPSWLCAVQWHPEFHRPGAPEFLPGAPLLEEFLQACVRSRVR